MNNESTHEEISFSDKNKTFEVFFPKECDLDKINRVTIRGRDFVEIVHGEWTSQWNIYFDDYVYFCSICNHRFCIKYNYCPNCGAKMDGEVTND